MKRICFPYIGNSVGGSHISSLLLARGLIGTEYEPFIVLHEKGPLSKILDERNIKYKILKLPAYLELKHNTVKRDFCFLLASLPILIFFLIKNKILIVHTNDWKMHGTWAWAAKLTGCGIVRHQRTKFSGVRQIAYAKLAHRVICISEYTRRSLNLPELLSNSFTIFNPFDVKREYLDRKIAKEKLLSEVGLKGGVATIGFFANFHERKRAHLYIDIANEVFSKTDKPIVFFLFGAGTEIQIDKLRNHINSLQLESKIYLMGFRYPIEDYMAGCDILLAPQVGEAFGRTLVESMLVKTPVIASSMGGHLEIIQHEETGFLVEPDFKEGFSNIILYLLCNPVIYRKVADAAYKYAVDKYSIENHVYKVKEIYDELSVIDSLFRKKIVSDYLEANIVIIIPHLGPGGAQKVASTLANVWSSKGKKILFITLTNSPADVYTLDAGVKRITYTSIARRLLKIPSILRLVSLRKVIKESGADTVISFICPTNIKTIIACHWLSDVKLIISERNDPGKQILGKWDRGRRWLYKRANVVTANSYGALDTMRSYVPENKLAYVPNPLVIPEISDDLAMNKEGNIFLAVGRIVPQKGYDVLLKAFASSKLSDKNWYLHFVGDGPVREELIALAESLGISGSIVWHGYVKNPLPYYRLADAFVMSSRFEGTPNALLEAMGSGIMPIINDSSAGPLELVENKDSGLVVPVDDVNAFSEALMFCDKNPKLVKEMALKAKDRVSDNLLDNAISVWEDVIAH